MAFDPNRFIPADMGANLKEGGAVATAPAGSANKLIAVIAKADGGAAVYPVMADGGDTALASHNNSDSALASTSFVQAILSAVPAGAPAANSVTTTHIVDGTIMTADLADGAVTGVKLADDAVSNSKLANMAANTFKINSSASAADPIDGTPAQVMTMLPLAGVFTKGAVPPTGTPSGKVLSDSNTWVSAASVPDQAVNYFVTGNVPAGYTIADGAPTTGCSIATATWGANKPSLVTAAAVTILSPAYGVSYAAGVAHIGAYAGDSIVMSSGNTIGRIPAVGGAMVAFATGLNNPTAIMQITTGLHSGSFLAVNLNSEILVRVPAAGGAAINFSTGYTDLRWVCGITLGAFAGDFLVVDGSSTILRVPAAGGAPVAFGTAASVSAVAEITSGSYAGSFAVATATSNGAIARIPQGGGSAVPWFSSSSLGATFVTDVYPVTTGPYAGGVSFGQVNKSYVVNNTGTGYALLHTVASPNNAYSPVNVPTGVNAGSFYIVDNNLGTGTLIKTTAPNPVQPYVKC